MGENKDILKPNTKKTPTFEALVNYFLRKREIPAPSIPSNDTDKKRLKTFKEDYKIEHEELADPFLAEAMEGFESLPDFKKSKSYITEINQKIAPEDKSDERRIFAFRIAAILLVAFLLSGSIYYLFNTLSSEQPELVEANKKEEKTTSPTITANADTALATTKDSNNTTSSLALINEPKKIENTLINPEEKDKKTIETKELAIPNSFPKLEGNPITSNEENRSIALVDPEEINDEISLVETNKDDFAPTRGSTDKSTTGPSGNQKKSASNRSMSPSMDMQESPISTSNTLEEGIKKYNEGLFSESKIIFDGVLSSQPKNQEALYYGGMADYNLGNYKLALYKLERVSSGSRRYDESRWICATIYLQQGNTKQAKSIFKQLAISQNPFAERAKEKLAELEK